MPGARRAATALAAALLGAAAAGAEPLPARSASGADPGEEIEVVGHHRAQSGQAETASAGAATAQLIEDRPLLRPGEVLELVPGLVITQHSGAGKANQYYLRGFNLDHGTDFATFLDGVPLNLRTHAHGQGYTDLNFLIPELVQRVDYVKGPYFAALGDFASAGAAEIRYLERLPETLLRLGGGSFGYLRGLVAGSPELGGGRLLYALELMHDDGPWARPDDYRRASGLLRFTAPLAGGAAALTALAYRGTWNATDQLPLRAVRQGLLGRFDTLDPTSGGDTFRGSLAASWLGSLAGGDLEALAYAVRYRLRLYSDFTYFLAQPERGDQLLQADDRWQLGSSGSWSRTLEAGGVATALRAGWEARVDRIAPLRLAHAQARQVWEIVRSDRVVESSGALFAEARSRWTAWLRTSAGLRLDRYRFDVQSSRAANGGLREAGRASPKLTAALGPVAGVELFAAWGQGFHSNDARGATMRVDPADGVTPVAPVTPLVRTRGAEAGLRAEPWPGLQASLALWRLDLASELLFTGDAGTTEPSRPSRRQGLEATGRWQPLAWLLLDLEVALSGARFTAPDPADPAAGSRVPGAIERAVSAGATVHRLGPWSASLFLRYFGPRPLVEDGSVRSAGATILNAQGSWQLSPRLRLEASILNLLDARADDVSYFYPSRLRTEPAPVDDVHFHPAVSRSLRASLALGF